MRKYAEKYSELADFWWIDAESDFGERKSCLWTSPPHSFLGTLGRKSMFPMWQFFALGERQRREEPGTSDFMLTDNLGTDEFSLFSL